MEAKGHNCDSSGFSLKTAFEKILLYRCTIFLHQVSEAQPSYCGLYTDTQKTFSVRSNLFSQLKEVPLQPQSLFMVIAVKCNDRIEQSILCLFVFAV